MTVARMREEMTQDEWVRWAVYYGRKAQRQQLAEGSTRGSRH